MYYKITNKKSEVYQKLHALRSKELKYEFENKELLLDRFGKFKEFLGFNGQQNLSRVTTYIGFKFTTPKADDNSAWKRHKDHKDIFVPNKRTKSGKEAQAVISKLKRSHYGEVFDILKVEHYGRFSFPFVEIVGDTVIIYVDEKQEPKDSNLIEITKLEFDRILKSNHSPN